MVLDAGVKIVNPDQLICTLDHKRTFEAEIEKSNVREKMEMAGHFESQRISREMNKEAFATAAAITLSIAR